MTEFLLWIAFLALTGKMLRLSRRVSELERLFVNAVAPEHPVAVVSIPEPEPVVYETAASPASPPLPPEILPEIAAEPEPEAQPAAQESKRVVDWEAMLGGDLLNKLGVLLLVVGIALFLGYSLRTLGPVGRIGLGAAMSATLLGLGIFAEKREGYQLFGRGLIGGGWAGLYFTTFAAYAVPAARVISNPAVGTVLLALVSAAMIVYSLRYRSETVTGMAYLLSFLTLGISGVPILAMIAAIPLVISLIYLSYRFGWATMITAGLPVAYAVFFLHSQGISSAHPALLKVLLVTYWIVFESAEVLRPSSSRLPFVFNAICFSFLGWGSPVLAASAYGASTAMRIAFRRDYRWSLTACSVLCGSAIFQHLSGLKAAIALLVEAEILFLVGVRYREVFVRGLAACAFSVGLGQLVVAGVDVHDRSWSMVAAVTGAVMYLNRYLQKSSWLYSWAGTALIAAVIAIETPMYWIAIGWLLLAGVLSEVHKRTAARELRLQAAVIGAIAVGVLSAVNVIDFDSWAPRPWQPQLAAALLLLAGGAGSNFAAPTSAAGAVMAAVFLWNVLPAPLVALGWGAVALALFEVGSATDKTWIRRQGEAMALAAFARIFFANLDILGSAFGLSHRLLTTLPIVVLQYYLYARGQRWFVYTGAIAAGALIRFEAGRVLTVIGWSAMALICQILGTKRENRDLRIQAYLLACAAFVRCWTTNFYEPDALSRVWIGTLVIALLFAAHLVSRRDLESIARPLFSTLASFLLSALLFYEVSGKLLTMAWAAQGAVLLASGFALRERHVRLTGLALLAACTAKLFFYDFSTLDTPYRIASFLVLGALLIGGSWIYTRYRKQIEGML